MRIYNTLSGTEEELEQPHGRPLNIFVCGPTVYDISHIGHARTYLTFDIFVRYLRSLGWKVSYLQNITDVDDKIIARAHESGEDPLAFAKKFTEEYFNDMNALAVASVDTYATASGFIPEITRQVDTLLKKEFAYTIEDDGIYYDIAKFPDYGKLSHRTAAQAEDSVSRIDESSLKRNKGDFCLWKFPKSRVETTQPTHQYTLHITKDGEPAWFTPLGWGRPGWHIEDTAITEKFYGPQYDIHGGGVDIKFPHHEAEIAQQEAASGKSPFVKIWMHVGSLLVGGKKMSKSLGNFITIRDFLKEHPPEIIRWIALTHHYRAPLNYTPEIAEQAAAELGSFIDTVHKLNFVAEKNEPGNATLTTPIREIEKKIVEAVDNDFHAAQAVSHLDAFCGEFRTKLWALSGKDADSLSSFVRRTLGIFGFSVPPLVIPPAILKLTEERELCRVNKQFTQSDALRKRIYTLGYVVDDTPLGPYIRKS